jgi:hypothetical protein
MVKKASFRAAKFHAHVISSSRPFLPLSALVYLDSASPIAAPRDDKRKKGPRTLPCLRPSPTAPRRLPRRRRLPSSPRSFSRREKERIAHAPVNYIRPDWLDLSPSPSPSPGPATGPRIFSFSGAQAGPKRDPSPSCPMINRPPRDLINPASSSLTSPPPPEGSSSRCVRRRIGPTAIALPLELLLRRA